MSPPLDVGELRGRARGGALHYATTREPTDKRLERIDVEHLLNGQKLRQARVRRAAFEPAPASLADPCAAGGFCLAQPEAAAVIAYCRPDMSEDLGEEIGRKGHVRGVLHTGRIGEMQSTVSLARSFSRGGPERRERSSSDGRVAYNRTCVRLDD
jgi:hypothetical protein